MEKERVDDGCLLASVFCRGIIRMHQARPDSSGGWPVPVFARCEASVCPESFLEHFIYIYDGKRG